MLLSERLEQPGMVYYLPKTIVALTIEARGNKYLKSGASLEDAVDPSDLVENIRDIRLKSVNPKVVADRTRSYSLHYDSNVASLDRVCMSLETSGLQQGLLGSVEGSADDKTGDIVISVAKLAGRAFGTAAFTPKTVTDAKDNYDKVLRSITVNIDPLNRSHWDQVNRAMYAAFGPVARDYRFSIENIDHAARDAGTSDLCPVNSVCYRTLTPVRFNLGTRSEGINSSIYKLVVNQKVTGRIDVSRAFMVEKITRLKFDKGVLSGVYIKKPSEALAAAKLPLTVLDAVATSALAAPGDFFSRFSGLPPEQVENMIRQSKTDVDNISLLSDKLASIRNGDFSATVEDDVATKDGILKLQCTSF